MMSMDSETEAVPRKRKEKKKSSEEIVSVCLLPNLESGKPESNPPMRAPKGARLAVSKSKKVLTGTLSNEIEMNVTNPGGFLL